MDEAQKQKGCIGCSIALAVIAVLFGFAIFVGYISDRESLGRTTRTTVSDAQKQKILSLLEDTDKLDAAIRKHDRKTYESIYLQLERDSLPFTKTLPPGSWEKDLLVNSINEYQEVVIAAKKSPRSFNSDETAAAATLGGLRKTLLRKALNNDLTSRERDLFEEWIKSR